MALPTSHLEDACVDYAKNRLEVGVTFVLSIELVKLSRTVLDKCSTVDIDGVVDIFFAPRARPTCIQRGDVVFTVIDNRPERKHIHKNQAVLPSKSEIVVRVYATVPCDGANIPSEWSLERWDVRHWCSTSGVFAQFMGSLLRCDQVAEKTVITASRTRPPRALLGARTPRAYEEIPSFPLVHAPLDTDMDSITDIEAELLQLAVLRRGEAAVFSELAKAAENGEVAVVTDLLNDVHIDVLRHLCSLGAIDTFEDMFGELTYSVRPAGIRLGIELRIDNPVYDIHFQREDQAFVSQHTITKTTNIQYCPSFTLTIVSMAKVNMPDSSFVS